MSDGAKPTVVITGVSGNLGLRLLRLLHDFNVTGVDLTPPQTDLSLRFEPIDFGRESACHAFVRILKQTKARAVVHLAFIDDPLRSGILEPERMWQINVAGTARVMEAITEVNRHDGEVDTFVFGSSASAYGPQTSNPATEEYPFGAHTLASALHARAADDVVRFRAESLGECTTYVLRSAIPAGPTMQHHVIDSLRGVPTGTGKRAERLRARGKRLPLLCPGKKYLDSRLQFVHVDDMARLVAYVLRKPAPLKNELKIMNVAGRGEPVTLANAAQIANARIMNVPGVWAMHLMVWLRWKFGKSAIPPAAVPYLIGSNTMDTTRLKNFLGFDYNKTIQHTVTEALQDCFRSESETQSAGAAQ